MSTSNDSFFQLGLLLLKILLLGYHTADLLGLERVRFGCWVARGLMGWGCVQVAGESAFVCALAMAASCAFFRRRMVALDGPLGAWGRPRVVGITFSIASESACACLLLHIIVLNGPFCDMKRPMLGGRIDGTNDGCVSNDCKRLSHQLPGLWLVLFVDFRHHIRPNRLTGSSPLVRPNSITRDSNSPYRVLKAVFHSCPSAIWI
ncbi:hypothetical protein FN846DRAFT_979456 [Sphaerosporella brunnea]|uniref:Uncharacterized protein n=1 Tax=Sphaerosporella brunnea TaxID=1250544 RepID=A0A5J5ECQ4_9PEZI|nr:hypothetical protein FN846DRAFT_979456 [Sphaerosporella brunnea]